MKDRLTQALRQARADYAEVRFETDDSTSVAYRGKEIERVSSGKFSGGIVRACVRGGWGVATFESLDDLDGQVREACRCAELVGREKTELAEAPAPKDAIVPAAMQRDFRGVGLDAKLALAGEYNQIILTADPRIETSVVLYAERFRTVHFASSRGAYYMEERPRVTLHCSAVARDGSLVQRASESWASTCDYGAVLGRQEKVRQAALRAAALLKAPPCPGGKMTVILDPELGGVFAHEAFGHLSEADFLYENPKMRELMHLGRPMGVPQLNIVDDGSLAGLLGTQRFDDEGTPMGRTYLIKGGVLSAHLHSLETAGKMGEAPTGNARAIGRSSVPLVRMTNTCIEGGRESFQDLIAGVDDGLYACDMLGGQTMMEMFTFSAAYGYRIRKGQVAELVRDVVLTGNVFETLHAMDAFGDDFRITQKGGGCGKGGQSPLPVTFGAPHLRIRDVLVGGR